MVQNNEILFYIAQFFLFQTFDSINSFFEQNRFFTDLEFYFKDVHDMFGLAKIKLPFKFLFGQKK